MKHSEKLFWVIRENKQNSRWICVQRGLMDYELFWQQEVASGSLHLAWILGQNYEDVRP